MFKALRICGVYGVVNLAGNGTAFKIDGCKEHKHQQDALDSTGQSGVHPAERQTVFNHDNGKGADEQLINPGAEAAGHADTTQENSHLDAHLHKLAEGVGRAAYVDNLHDAEKRSHEA